MGQAVKPWMGDSHRLDRALALRGKSCLTSRELAVLVEGGRLCNRHGLRLLCSGRENLDVTVTLDALLTTSRTLLDQAAAQLQGEQGARVPEDARQDLSDEVGKALRESSYLALWAGRLTSPGAARRFDA
jgi:hypothetical protein